MGGGGGGTNICHKFVSIKTQWLNAMYKSEMFEY